MKKRLNTLQISNWYPGIKDPLSGIFIKKHLKAISMYANVALLHVTDNKSQKSKYLIESKSTNSFLEVIVNYRKPKGIFSKIIRNWRIFIAYNKGLKFIINKNGKIDLIHHHVTNLHTLISWWLSAKWKVNYIITEHWTGFNDQRYQKKNQFIKWIYAFLIKNAKAVTVVSEPLFKNMQKNGLTNDNFHIIPNIVDQFNKNSFIIDKQNNNHIKILIAADLVDEKKNISGLIKAIADAALQVPEIQLHILGDGPDKKKLTDLANGLKLIDKHVFFHGAVTPENVYQYLYNSDFSVINSHVETFSVFMAESLMCGKPVIATRCGGPETFIDEKCGLLIPVNDQNALTEAIVYLCKNYKKYDSEYMKDRISQNFLADKIGNQFNDLYTSILKKN